MDKGDEPPLSVPPAPALKEVAVVNPTPTPLSLEERNVAGLWKLADEWSALFA